MSAAALPDSIARVLDGFLTDARSILGPRLISAVLYGSAAENRLRPASDVNLILVLSAFEPAQAELLRQPYAAAEAAIRLRVMFLLASEVAAAAECFGQKFSDIVRRHRVLFGPDPFAEIVVPRAALVARLNQVLLNLLLRLRASYIQSGATPERLSAVIADAAGPLRSCAATLRELESQPSLPPKEALQQFVAQLQRPGSELTLAHISAARERQLLPVDAAGPALLHIIDWAAAMRARTLQLR